MSTSQPTEEPSEKVYKLKYQLLKRCIKEIVLENAALCDRASDMQHQIIIAQEERKFLWKKFMSTQGNSFAEDMLTNSANGQPPEPKRPPKKSTTSQKSSGGTSKARQTVSRTKIRRKTVDRTNSNENA